MVLVFTYTTPPPPIKVSKGVKEEISSQKDNRRKGPDNEMSWLYPRHKEHISVTGKWLVRETISRSKQIKLCRVLKTVLSKLIKMIRKW